MKKIIILFFIIIGLCVYMPVLAQEIIDDFSVEIKINTDASINVVEKIGYDFGDLQKHGIYRDIPYKYKARGGNYNLRFSDIKVTDEKGNSYEYEVSNYGKNKRIKIGNADKYVSGKKSYIISYKVKRVINFFDNHDELYWNATGNDWTVEIKNQKQRFFCHKILTKTN